MNVWYTKACCYNLPKVECNHKPNVHNNKLLFLSDGVSKVCACLGMLLALFQALKRLLISHMELQCFDMIQEPMHPHGVGP